MKSPGSNNIGLFKAHCYTQTVTCRLLAHTYTVRPKLHLVNFVVEVLYICKLQALHVCNKKLNQWSLSFRIGSAVGLDERNSGPSSTTLLARDVIYTSHAYATVSVSVCLSVTEVHWVTVHAGKREGSSPERVEGSSRVMLATARPSCWSYLTVCRGEIFSKSTVVHIKMRHVSQTTPLSRTGGSMGGRGGLAPSLSLFKLQVLELPLFKGNLSSLWQDLI